MRLRNISGARERIATDKYVVQSPKSQKGHWHEFFGNDHPIHIEVGMGKGRFILSLAAANPKINYIGIEKYSSVLIRALDKRPELETDNLVFIRLDATAITDVFDKDEISRIYLNFSDPWPKDRHAKRRLTSTLFLERYGKILVPGGEIQFKTDNTPLFDFSLEQIALAGWETKEVNYNLHEHGPAPGNIMTEYEERFYEKGNPIHKLVAYKKTRQHG